MISTQLKLQSGTASLPGKGLLALGSAQVVVELQQQPITLHGWRRCSQRLMTAAVVQQGDAEVRTRPQRAYRMSIGSMDMARKPQPRVILV